MAETRKEQKLRRRKKKSGNKASNNLKREIREGIKADFDGLGQLEDREVGEMDEFIPIPIDENENGEC